MSLKNQLVLYFILGGILTLIEWAGFYFLAYLCGVHYILSNLLLFVLMIPLGMLVFKKAIFKTTKLKPRNELLLTYAINIVGIVLNTLILWILVEFFTLESLIAKIIASFLVAFYSFFARKKLIYSK